MSATTPSPRDPDSRAWGLLLVVVLVVGAIVRLDGITFGLPYTYDVDEQDFVRLATAMLHNHDLNPHWFGHPGTTLLYLMCALYLAMFGVGRMTGIYTGPSSFEAAYLHDVSPFYLVPRLLIVAFALLSIVLTYRIGQKLFGNPTALLGAAFLALSPLNVEFSQRIRSDMLMTVFILAAFWFCVRIIETGSLRSYLLAGASIALATDSKYPGILMIAPLLVAHFFSPVPRHRLKLLWSGLSFAGTSFAASPFLYLDFSQTLHDLHVENRAYEFGGVGTGPIGNALWYVQTPLQHALTAAGLIGAVAGIIFLLRDRRPQGLLLVVPPLALLAFLSCLHLRWERWVVPTVPFFSLILAYGITRLCSLRSNSMGRLITAGSALAVAGIFASMVWADAVSGAEQRGVDTRTAMAQYILTHVAPGSTLLLDTYTCELPKARYHFYEVDEGTGGLRSINARLLRHDLYEPLGMLSRLQNLATIRSDHVEFILVNGDIYSQLRTYPDHYRRELAMDRQIAALGAPVYQLHPVRGQSAGPELVLLHVAQPATVPAVSTGRRSAR